MSFIEKLFKKFRKNVTGQKRVKCYRCGREPSEKLKNGEYWCSWCGKEFNPKDATRAGKKQNGIKNKEQPIWEKAKSFNNTPAIKSWQSNPKDVSIKNSKNENRSKESNASNFSRKSSAPGEQKTLSAEASHHRREQKQDMRLDTLTLTELAEPIFRFIRFRDRKREIEPASPLYAVARTRARAWADGGEPPLGFTYMQAVQHLSERFADEESVYIWLSEFLAHRFNFRQAALWAYRGLAYARERTWLTSMLASVLLYQANVTSIGWYMQSCLLGAEDFEPYLLLSRAAEAIGCHSLHLRLLNTADILSRFKRMPLKTSAIGSLARVADSSELKAAFCRFEQNIGAYLLEADALPIDEYKREIRIMANPEDLWSTVMNRLTGPRDQPAAGDVSITEDQWEVTKVSDHPALPTLDLECLLCGGKLRLGKVLAWPDYIGQDNEVEQLHCLDCTEHAIGHLLREDAYAVGASYLRALSFVANYRESASQIHVPSDRAASLRCPHCNQPVTPLRWTQHSDSYNFVCIPVRDTVARGGVARQVVLCTECGRLLYVVWTR